MVQRHSNHFPELEEAAEELRRARRRLTSDDLYPGLVRYRREAARRPGADRDAGAAAGVLRRFDPATKTLRFSELLRRGAAPSSSRTRSALLTAPDLLDQLAQDPGSRRTSRARSRASRSRTTSPAPSLMPYGAFIAGREGGALRHRRARSSLPRGFEQVCHRLTTLRRPGAEGVPFHMIRIDVAGNISKRFSASGIRFARFSGACPRWNVQRRSSRPGMIRIQVSRMPDRLMYFWLARTIQKDSGGYHAQQPVQAIGLGCSGRRRRSTRLLGRHRLEERPRACPSA